jgi:hypothetical protein
MPSTPHVANVLAIGPKIFLDDERAPPPGNWLVVRDATKFRALLRDHEQRSFRSIMTLAVMRVVPSFQVGSIACGSLLTMPWTDPQRSAISGWSCCTARIQLAVQTCVACWRVHSGTAFCQRPALSNYR